MGKEIKLLKKFLEKNNKAELAFKLGYDNTNVIDGWIRSLSIPKYQVDRLFNFIKERENETAERFSGTR